MTIFPFLMTMFPKVDLGVNYYQRQFELKFSGSLTSGYEVLFSDEGNTFAAAIHQCSKFCHSDIRCVGMELCRERDDMYRCRACCETTTLKDKDLLYNDNSDCRYMEMVRNFFSVQDLQNFHKYKYDFFLLKSLIEVASNIII